QVLLPTETFLAVAAFRRTHACALAKKSQRQHPFPLAQSPQNALLVLWLLTLHTRRRHSGAPPHIGRCRCAHPIVPTSRDGMRGARNPEPLIGVMDSGLPRFARAPE